jgi:hypothetical protein
LRTDPLEQGGTIHACFLLGQKGNDFYVCHS